MPFSDEEGQDGADKGDDDAVDDKPAAQQDENDVLSRTLFRREKLRFRRHHGILPEPELPRKCGAGVRSARWPSGRRQPKDGPAAWLAAGPTGQSEPERTELHD